MFRAAAPGPYDEAVAKATDENATSEDWAAILEVCDRVNADAANGPKEAVASLIKRLAHRNANVQLYALELANALSQNCGIALHRELASRAFTEALLKLANDRNTHQVVRVKILERMQEWSGQFASNTDLGIMQDACARLQQSQPRLQTAVAASGPPPSAPQKDQLTEQDRQREEDDLQRALKLSLEEENHRRGSGGGGASGGGGGSNIPDAADPHGLSTGAAGAVGAVGISAGGASAAATSAAPPQPATAATVSRVRALFDFTASEADELTFKKGDVIAVLESVYRDWWRGSLRGQTGIFPLNYVEILADPTPEELEREAQMEAQVFAEIKNVEKLLTLLSASNAGPREEDSDEISTLAIRPNLIRLIEKYSQKKDDFTQLNEKFIKARRDYEALLESSMAHPPQPNYPQQYGMRPAYPNTGAPGGAAAAPAPYHVLGGQPQPDQRYYTPGPQRQEYVQSPSPNYHRHSMGAAPAPFYLVNDPAASATPPPQQQQQQQRQRLPSGSGPGGPGGPSNGRPSPLQTNGAGMDSVSAAPLSAPPPTTSNSGSNQTYLPYNPTATAPLQHHHAPPSSYYGGNNNPQELSTSAYDISPVATQQPQPQQQQPQQYQADVPRPLSVAANSNHYTGAGYGTPPPPQQPAFGAPASPLTQTTAKLERASLYEQPQQQQQQQQQQQHGYAYPGQQQQPAGPAVSAVSLPLSPPSPGPGPGPAQQPQQPPQAAYPSTGGAAPPVPAGYYDARHTLPSQRLQQQQQHGSPPADAQQQYQAYAPPAAAEHHAPAVAASADDYYRY